MPLFCNMDITRPKQAIKKLKRYLDSPSEITPTVKSVAKKANRVAAKSAQKPVAAKPLPDPQVLEEYLPPGAHGGCGCLICY
jgi:hypothetical protein